MLGNALFCRALRVSRSTTNGRAPGGDWCRRVGSMVFPSSAASRRTSASGRAHGGPCKAVYAHIPCLAVSVGGAHASSWDPRHVAALYERSSGDLEPGGAHRLNMHRIGGLAQDAGRRQRPRQKRAAITSTLGEDRCTSAGVMVWRHVIRSGFKANPHINVGSDMQHAAIVR